MIIIMKIINNIKPYKNELLDLIKLFYSEIIKQYNKINVKYLIESNDIEHNYYIAIENNIVVGYINYCFDDEYDNTIMINQLFVLEEYRNKGIATLLLKRLFNRFEEYNFCLGVVSSNDSAKRLYNKLGFTKPTFQFLFRQKGELRIPKNITISDFLFDRWKTVCLPSSFQIPTTILK